MDTVGVLCDIKQFMKEKKKQEEKNIVIDIHRWQADSPIRVHTWDRAINIVQQYIYKYQNPPEIATGGNPSDFDQLVERRIEKIRSVLCKKAKEYASDNDRFYNFRAAARKRNTTPADALMGMKVKHEVSIDDLITERIEVTEALIDEKIGDNINYFILLEGLLKERLDHVE